MKRIITAVVVTIEVLGVCAAGLAVTLLPLLLLWLGEAKLSTPVPTMLGVASVVWLLSLGAELSVTLPAETVQLLGVGGDPLRFLVTLSPLAVTLITALSGFFLGRRAAASNTPIVGLVAGSLVLGAVTWMVASWLVFGLVRVDPVAATVAAVLRFTVASVAGFVTFSVQRGTARWVRFSNWVGLQLPGMPLQVLRSLALGARQGWAFVVGLIGFAAALLAVLIVLNYVEMMRLTQALHVGLVGSFALLLLQAALLPNAIVWVASWLLGPGFAVGVGSSVTMLATEVGPLPALPLLAAIPEGTHQYALLGLLLPVLVGVLFGARGVAALRAVWGGSPSAWVLLLPPVAASLTAAAMLAALAADSAGAAGPARFAVVGPDVVAVARWGVLLVFASTLLGGALGWLRARTWVAVDAEAVSAEAQTVPIDPALRVTLAGADAGLATGVVAGSLAGAIVDPDSMEPMGVERFGIVVLISGGGSNLAALLAAADDPACPFRVLAVGADTDAPGLAHARDRGLPSFVVRPGDFASRHDWGVALLDRVQSFRPNLTVSAGLMRILPPVVVRGLSPALINTHPALLPHFPGAHAVRDALAAGAAETGVTVHIIDEGVDTGPVLRQATVPVHPGDTVELLQERIKTVERPLLVGVVTDIANATITLKEPHHS